MIPAHNKDSETKPELSVQNLETLDPTKLTPLDLNVISRQATINIGTIGHVAHGKSTVVKALSGRDTIRFKTEMVRNITIKLGYANAKIYKCDAGEEKCPSPGCYCSKKSLEADEFPCENPNCNGTMKIVRHVSFVDCPGHDILMATMLNGAAVMDGALLLIAGNETCPQPQTSEHLAAVMIMKLKDIIILQNKIDLVKKSQALHQHREIKHFTKDTIARDAPIIPISGQKKFNIEAVCQHLVESIPIPKRDFISPARLIVIRSFDVNKPGEEIEQLKGGVAGGSILQGVLRVGQKIEIRPGVVQKDKSGALTCKPLYSEITTLYAEENELQYAVPGGLIGVGTKIDPSLTRADRLVGQVLGDRGSLPDIFTNIEISFFLLTRLLGVKANAESTSNITPLEINESLMVNIGSTSVGATVVGVQADAAKLTLTRPVCASVDEKLALSRRIEKHWRLIGWGKIIAGESVPV